MNFNALYDINGTFCIECGLFLLFYPYVIYPLILIAIGKLHPAITPERLNHCPMVSFVISVYNSESSVRDKIENLSGLDYPQDCIEIIVVSDGSTDGTVDFLHSIDTQTVHVIDLVNRVGKTEAENQAIGMVSGEIIVFTDSSTLLERAALKELVKYFNNPNVGAVSTVDRLVSEQDDLVGEGENAYVRMEMTLRKCAGAAGMLIGLSGSCFACRRSLFQIIPAETARDLATAFLAVRNSYLNISAEGAICHIKTQQDIRKEYFRKVRTVNNGLATVMNHLYLLNFFKYGRASFALISHKILRWFSFPIIIMIMLASIIAFEHWYAKCLFVALLVCFAAGGYAFVSGKSIPLKAGRLAANFTISVFAAFWGIVEYTVGKRYTWWSPTKR